ncbi:MAG: hypothetical protein HY000_41720 [Planctomycetes bacterium]|nr:hypothetical protein [Planctomycetota bacterium]
MSIAECLLSVLGAGGVGAALAALVVLAARTWITERIRNEIKHEYDQKLEAFKSEIRAEEAVKDAARSSFAATHSAALERRLEAVSTLWQATMRMRRAAPSTVYVVDPLDAARFADFLKQAAKNEAIRAEFSFEALGKATANAVGDADGARPFVGDYVYSFFDAYRSLLLLVAMNIQMGFDGASARPWHDGGRADFLLKSFMSDDEFADFGKQMFKFEWTRRLLERKMLNEMKRVISGEESSDSALEQALRIEQAAEKARSESRAAASPLAKAVTG